MDDYAYIAYLTPSEYGALNGLSIPQVFLRLKEGLLPYIIDDEGIKIKVEYHI